MPLENIYAKCAYAFSHGVDSKNLGLVPFYYSLVYMTKAKTCVVLGSGGGVVPMACRQAQRDLGIESETWLIDAFYKEAGYGHPEEKGGWALPGSALQTHFPEIKVVRKKTDECGGLIPKIDFLFVDAEHTYQAVLSDFSTFLPNLSPQAFVGFHDTADVGIQRAVSEIAEKYDFEILNLRDMASGVSIIRKSTKNGYEKNMYDDCLSRPAKQKWELKPVDHNTIKDDDNS